MSVKVLSSVGIALLCMLTLQGCGGKQEKAAPEELGVEAESETLEPTPEGSEGEGAEPLAGLTGDSDSAEDHPSLELEELEEGPDGGFKEGTQRAPEESHD